MIGIEESEDSQFKGPVNIFNKSIEENFPSLKKEKPMNIQEAYRTPKQTGPEKKISGAEDSIENIDATVKENTKCKRS